MVELYSFSFLRNCFPREHQTVVSVIMRYMGKVMRLNPTQGAYQWSSRFDLVGGPNALRRHMVVIAGPTGAGKTTVARTLSELDPTFTILRNYTTRMPRPSDQDGHFTYLSDEDFLRSQSEDRFFLARLSPRPRYGYRAEEFRELVAKGNRPVLMFRHSGAFYLTESLGCVVTVFLEGNPEEVACCSRNTESRPTSQDIREAINANRSLQQVMTGRGCRFLCITNTYQGDVELKMIAGTVREFLSVKLEQ